MKSVIPVYEAAVYESGDDATKDAILHAYYLLKRRNTRV
jgi:hypothetical protein